MRPIEGATIQFLSDDGLTVIAETTSDVNGLYAVVIPTKRRVLLRVSKEGYSTAEMPFYTGSFTKFQDSLVVLVPLQKA
jgi:hypothetical protein